MGKIKEWYDLFLLSFDGKDKTKKGIQNLIIILGVGILMLLIGGFFTKNDSNKTQSDKKGVQNVIQTQGYVDQYDVMLENKIKNILSEINGVGKVSIAITYSSSKEIVPAEDVKQNQTNINEKDKEGGVRSTLENDTDSKIILGQKSDAVPVVLKEIPPQVRGVVVVAEGAKNEGTKVDIAKAVSTALGISLSKIQVFPMGS